MKEGLRGQAISGFGWRAVERYSTQSAQFLVSIVLARILTPHEFGLIALVMVFVSFGQVLIDGGFSDALVQSEHADDACCSSVFFCNIVVGLPCWPDWRSRSCCAACRACSARPWPPWSRSRCSPSTVAGSGRGQRCRSWP